MFTTKKLQTTALAAAVPLLGALVLAGCSDTDPDESAGSGSTPTAAVSAPITPSTAGTINAGALTAAAKTALAAVSGGKILSIEQEVGSSWEILVVTSDGGEQEVHTGADGTSITARPTKKSSDADDLAENKRFVAASGIGYAKAASTMTATVPGTVAELGLDDHLGKTVWDGDVVDSSGTKHSIRLDSTSGSVVTNTVDTDD